MDKREINFWIGILLAISGGLFMFLDIGIMPSRIILGILGIILIAVNSPYKR